MRLPDNFTQRDGCGSIAGTGPEKCSARRSQASAKTLRPSMKCQVFSASRGSLPFGNSSRNSIQAYTAAISSSISQCSAMDSDPYRNTLLRQVPESRCPSLNIRQAPYVGREDADLVGAEEFAPGRHHPAATLAYGFDQRGAAAAVEPGLVRQVRGTERGIALAVGSMAGNAVGREQFLAAGRAQLVVYTTRKRGHIVGQIGRALVTENFPPRRHHRIAPVGDGGNDRVRISAIEPVAIGKIGISLAAARVGCVALRAIVQEQPLAHLARLRVASDLGHGHGGILRVDRLVHLTRLCKIRVMLAARTPVEQSPVTA